MLKKTFPKDGEKKKNEQIKELKAHIKYLEKHVKFLENEILNSVKPVRRKPKLKEPTGTKPKMTREEFRKDLLKRFKESLNGNKTTT